MKNTRIGFAKKEVCEGAQEPIFINEEFFKISEVVDPRFVWSVIDIQSTKKVRFIKQVKGGTFLVSSIPLDNRDDDNYSIWTYFPQGIEVSKEQLQTIINVVDKYLDDRNKPDDDLKELAEKEYLVHLAEDIPASSGTGIAFVNCVGDDDLYKYLGDGRSQNSYEDVKAIILKEEGVEIRKEAEDVIKNYSSSPVIEKYAFLAPDDNLLGSPEDRFSLFIIDEDNRKVPFTNICFVKKGAKVQLVLERKNFEPKEFSIQVTEHEQKCVWKETEWMKKIKLSDFKVSVEPSGKPARNVRITINNVILDDRDGITLTEKDLSNVSIRIEADDCEPYTHNGYIDVPHRLMKIEKEYTWEVQFQDRCTGELKIKSRKDYRRSESPIEWYVMGHDDALHFDYRKYYRDKRNAIVFGFVIGSVLVGIGWTLHHFNVDRSCFNYITTLLSNLE